MGRQAIDYGDFPNDTNADTIRTAFTKTDDNFVELYHGGAANHVRYVSKEGSDSNDGKTWGTAKLTVAAALTSLPQTSARPNGWVKVGRGTFVETATPMVVGTGLVIEGMGHGSAATEPTRIQLGDSKDTHLFECTQTSSNNHGLMFKDLELDGNKANQSSSANANLIELAGGYGCALYNVALSRAAKWGIRLVGGYMNVQMLNITGASCGSATQGGWIFCDNTQNGGVVSIDGAQVDQCGIYPLLIQYGQDGGGPELNFKNMKFEQQDSINTTLHTNCIRFVPRLTGVGNRLFITIENCVFINQSVSADTFEAAIYEHDPSAGIGASWLIINCDARDQYTKLFKSAKTSRTSFARHVRMLVEHPDNGASATTAAPCVELAGIGIFVGTGAPAVDAPIGSLYQRRDGGASTTLYVKTATGTGGWTAK